MENYNQPQTKEKQSEFQIIINRFEDENSRLYNIVCNISSRIDMLYGIEPTDKQTEQPQSNPDTTIIKKINSLLLKLNNITSKLEHCDNRLTDIVGKL